MDGTRLGAARSVERLLVGQMDDTAGYYHLRDKRMWPNRGKRWSERFISRDNVDYRCGC